MPYWMTAIGGYTELATQVVVMGLAAMSLNFLLGFTGVLSFGHAAYFGLGGYGTAMAIKYWNFGTLPAMAVGVADRDRWRRSSIGGLIVRRRGVYFAMVTIAFGQVFYFIAYRWNEVTGGDDGLSGWSRQPLDLGFANIDIVKDEKAFYYFVLVVFAVCAAAMARLIASPLGPLAGGDPRERAARALSRPQYRAPHLALVRHLLFLRLDRRRALSRCSTISSIRARCASTSPAISSSWR